MKKNVCLCGNFGAGKPNSSGQIIKTKMVEQVLLDRVDRQELGRLDKINTAGRIQGFFRFFCLIFGMFIRNDSIVIMPAYIGIYFVVPCVVFLNKFFHRRIVYIVIGGWLPRLVRKNRWILRHLQKMDAILLETNTMKKALNEQGLNNCWFLPNAKDLKIVSSPNSKVYLSPFRLCTFSRVMREKGIEDIVQAVLTVNAELQKRAFELDIYGAIEYGQEEWFSQLQATFDSCINYKGLVDSSRSTEYISSYFMLVFPTRFFTEGIPGTIIDAYASGVPVLSSRWESFEDVVDEGQTGLGYTFASVTSLIEELRGVYFEPTKIEVMRPLCLAKAKLYTIESFGDALCPFL